MGHRCKLAASVSFIASVIRYFTWPRRFYRISSNLDDQTMHEVYMWAFAEVCIRIICSYFPNFSTSWLGRSCWHHSCYVILHIVKCFNSYRSWWYLLGALTIGWTTLTRATMPSPSITYSKLSWTSKAVSWVTGEGNGIICCQRKMVWTSCVEVYIPHNALTYFELLVHARTRIPWFSRHILGRELGRISK